MGVRGDSKRRENVTHNRGRSSQKKTASGEGSCCDTKRGKGVEKTGKRTKKHTPIVRGRRGSGKEEKRKTNRRN